VKPRRAGYNHTSDCSSFEIANPRTLLLLQVRSAGNSAMPPFATLLEAQASIGVDTRVQILRACGQFCGPQLRRAITNPLSGNPHGEERVGVYHRAALCADPVARLEP